MKDGTTELLKFKQLQRDLRLSLWKARGLLDTLWWFVKQNCPRGDIGRFTNEEIATGIEWDGDHDRLIAALVARHWLDEDSGCRLVVHSWPDHCETSVHRSLAMQGLTFICGTEPNDSKLTQNERERAQKRRDGTRAAPVRHPCGTRAAKNDDEKSRAATQPEPEPYQALPSQSQAAPALTSGVSKEGREGDLNPTTLKDAASFDHWCRREMSLAHGLVKSDDDLVFARSLRAKALSDKSIRSPVGFVKDSLLERDHTRVQGRHEDAARIDHSTGPPLTLEPELAAAVKNLARKQRQAT